MRSRLNPAIQNIARLESRQNKHWMAGILSQSCFKIASQDPRFQGHKWIDHFQKLAQEPEDRWIQKSASVDVFIARFRRIAFTLMQAPVLYSPTPGLR